MNMFYCEFVTNIAPKQTKHVVLMDKITALRTLKTLKTQEPFRPRSSHSATRIKRPASLELPEKSILSRLCVALGVRHAALG